MEKLTSMIDFVLEKRREAYSNDHFADLVENNALFLNQPLNIGMFVPAKLVNGEWIVLKKPCGYNNFLEYGTNDFLNIEECDEYKKAKDMVLFEGFKYDFKKEWFINENMILDEEFILYKTIEDLVKYNLELTKTAKKQIGL